MWLAIAPRLSANCHDTLELSFRNGGQCLKDSETMVKLWLT